MKNYISKIITYNMKTDNYVIHKDRNEYRPIIDEIAQYVNDTEIFYDARIDKKITIPLILVADFGVFVFLSNNDETKAEVHINNKRRISEMLRINDENSYFFIINEKNETGSYIDVNNAIMELDDPIQRFMNLYDNLKLPEIYKNRLNMKNMANLIEPYPDMAKIIEKITSEDSTLDKYKKIVLPKAKISYILNVLENGMSKSILRHDTRFNDEGIEYRKHTTFTRFLSIAKGEAYYRVSDDDITKVLLITLFGGIFGLHHFLRGNFGLGFLYLITGGGFGILYISDIFMMCTGGYSYYEVNYGFDENKRQVRNKEKVYLSELNDKRLKAACIPISIIIAICSVFMLILPLYKDINRSIENNAIAVAESYIEQNYGISAE